MQSIMAGKTWSHEYEEADHVHLAEEAKGDHCLCSVHFLFLFSVQPHPSDGAVHIQGGS